MYGSFFLDISQGKFRFWLLNQTHETKIQNIYESKVKKKKWKWIFQSFAVRM